MKAVMRELAQAKRHYSTLPLFQFLRDEALSPRDRFAFFPAMAPFILAFSDLNRHVFRDESSKDPQQRLINENTYEHDHHWPWYLEDFTKLGFDRTLPMTQLHRMTMRDELRHNRMLAPRLAQLAYRATPIEKLVIVEAIEETCNVLFGLTGILAARIEADGGPVLRYLGQCHFSRETGHATHRYDRRVLEAIALGYTERVRCLDFAFHVFDLFADWSNELNTYARRALAQRTTPHIVHASAALRIAP
jgi:hypothetical protein